MTTKVTKLVSLDSIVDIICTRQLHSFTTKLNTLSSDDKTLTKTCGYLKKEIPKRKLKR